MCGLVGIVGHSNLERMFRKMHRIQHRGNESAGIAYLKPDGAFHRYATMGFANDLFREHNLGKEEAFLAIGHLRYSTGGASTIENAHPIVVTSTWGTLAIVHNGTLANHHNLRANCAHQPDAKIDTALILQLIRESKALTLDDAIVETTQKIGPAFSALIMSADAIYAIRDSYGFWPLWQYHNKDAKQTIFASETTAFADTDETYDDATAVPAGAIIKTTPDGTITELAEGHAPKSPCSFERLYMGSPAAREETDQNNGCLYGLRKKFGHALAIQCKHLWYFFDVVASVPDSGDPAASGFHEACSSEKPKIVLMPLLLRSHYTTRTFIQPGQRKKAVDLKFIPIASHIEGKRIAIIDDSLVRSTTMAHVVNLLYQNGAKAVHVFIASPQIKHPCPFGIDMKSRGELVAASNTDNEIKKIIKASTLNYLSIENFQKCLNAQSRHMFCTGCFTGKYPLDKDKT